MDVRSVFEYLTDGGLEVWFDAETIRPGDDWINAMQDGLWHSRTCVVFFRKDPGPWQQEESKAALQRKNETAEFRIIPVLLPGAPDRPVIPPFVKGSAWVDLRAGLFNVPALKKLVDSIRGVAEVPIHIPSSQHPPNSKLPTGYKADVEKIIGLLIGESLYKERYVCVREIIQNAVDACERRRRSAFGRKPEIVVSSDSIEGYFEVTDNGEGMSVALLAECFAVVGKSIRDEPSVFELMASHESTRLHLIARFGIGFISTYILSQKVLISTSYEGEEQVNLAITSITQPFVYSSSPVGDRPPTAIGTTVRVFLKPEYCPSGERPVDIAAAVRLYCRHGPNVKLIEDRTTAVLPDDWNTSLAKVVHAVRLPYRWEMRLGIGSGTIDLITSHAGFLVCKNSEAILPDSMPAVIGGEINCFPGAVDINVARDAIVDNSAAHQLKTMISSSIKQVLVKAVKANHKDLRDTLSVLLMFFFDAARDYESKKNKLDLPLTSVEAAELLIDAWYVTVEGREMSFRQALENVRRKDRYRVYYYDRLRGRLQDVQALLRDNLAHRGFIILQTAYRSIELKHGGSKYVDMQEVLKGLATRYGFDVVSVGQPWAGDIESLLADVSSLSPVVRSIVAEIGRSKGKDIRVGRLHDAPAAFQLEGHDYLNLDNPIFAKLDRTAGKEEVASTRAFILGLLQYDLS